MKFEIELNAGDERFHSLVEFLNANNIDYSHPHILLQTDVSGRSKQLIDFAVKEGYFDGVPKGNLMGLIDRFKKSINCR